MDRLELARRAGALRHDAAAAGLPPDPTPYSLALAAAAVEGVRVRGVRPGSPLLHGGQATFDPETGLVLHQRTGNPFEEAFLVAHELGHVVLEAGPGRHVTSDVDPHRGAEPLPSSADGVTDYGRRQRREVMMDLFARELLLPRRIARDLHLQEGLSARDIAARRAIPWRVVALQLLDALLLPPAPGAPPGREEPPLNGEQAAAVAHSGSPLLLEAGPGTGKTRTLVAKVADLVGRGVDPASILVLTFSNAAAAELADRITARCPEAAPNVWIGTFHSFGYDLLHRFHDLEGLPPSPRLLDRPEAVELLEDRFTRLELEIFRDLYDPSRHIDDILDAISRANDEVVDAAEYCRLADEMWEGAPTDDRRGAADRCREVGVVFRAYEELKRERNCLDFGDLVARPVRLLERHPEVLARLRETHRHVLVDEFQDVNRASVRLLGLLTGDGADLWAVGDARQSIYRFRGASSFNVARFGSEDFPGGKRRRLRVNYRSRGEIVDAFTRFAAKGMREGIGEAPDFEAFRGPSGFPVEHRAVADKVAEATAVAEAILEMRATGLRWSAQAVLCTSNDRIAELGASLEALGIPVLHLGDLFERAEIKDLLCLLSLVTDRRAAGLLRVAAMPGFRMPLDDAAAIVARLAGEDAPALGWRGLEAGMTCLSPAGRDSLAKLSATFESVTTSARPWDVLAGLLLDRTRMAADLAASNSTIDRVRAIAVWQLMNVALAEATAGGYPIHRFLERIRRLLLLSEDRDLRRLPGAASGIDAVRIMTIHGSKGLEFPVVHLPGLSGDTVPRKFKLKGCLPPDRMIKGTEETGEDAVRAGHDEEQECLFFVALSRARDRLLLYSSLRKTNSHRRSPSPFVACLGETVASREVVPRLVLPPEPPDLPLPPGVTVPARLRASDLDHYSRCPRRFLYTTVLRTGGRQSEVAFRQMHAAVQQVVAWLAADHELEPAPAELRGRLAQAWETHGPARHGYSEDYMAVAVRLLGHLVAARHGRVRSAASEMTLGVEGIQLVVRPDEASREGTGDQCSGACGPGTAGNPTRRGSRWPPSVLPRARPAPAARSSFCTSPTPSSPR